MPTTKQGLLKKSPLVEKTVLGKMRLSSPKKKNFIVKVDLFKINQGCKIL